MEDLIEALQIFLRYGNPHSPTHCEHDVLYVMVEPGQVSDEDKEKLDELRFLTDEELNCFYSFRFGSS
jgi:hypothetical protein